MSERINHFTGKPMPSGAYFGRAAGYKCERCDTDAVCDCMICGAPNCCPRCCWEADQEDRALGAASPTGEPT